MESKKQQTSKETVKDIEVLKTAILKKIEEKFKKEYKVTLNHEEKSNKLAVNIENKNNKDKHKIVIDLKTNNELLHDVILDEIKISISNEKISDTICNFIEIKKLEDYLNLYFPKKGLLNLKASISAYNKKTGEYVITVESSKFKYKISMKEKDLLLGKDDYIPNFNSKKESCFLEVAVRVFVRYLSKQYKFRDIVKNAIKDIKNKFGKDYKVKCDYGPLIRRDYPVIVVTESKNNNTYNIIFCVNENKNIITLYDDKKIKKISEADMEDKTIETKFGTTIKSKTIKTISETTSKNLSEQVFNYIKNKEKCPSQKDDQNNNNNINDNQNDNNQINNSSDITGNNVLNKSESAFFYEP